MKRKIPVPLAVSALALVVFILSSCASARVDPLPADDEGTPLPLMRRGMFDGGVGVYEFLDGQEVRSSSQLNEILLQIPQNERIVRCANVWSGVTIGLASLAAASLATSTVFTIGDTLPHAGTISTAFSITAILSGLGGLFSSSVLEGERQKAVDNYNLYIQGIPVK